MSELELLKQYVAENDFIGTDERLRLIAALEEDEDFRKRYAATLGFQSYRFHYHVVNLFDAICRKLGIYKYFN
jgi:hypothetical protein